MRLDERGENFSRSMFFVAVVALVLQALADFCLAARRELCASLTSLANSSLSSGSFFVFDAEDFDVVVKGFAGELGDRDSRRGR